MGSGEIPLLSPLQTMMVLLFLNKNASKFGFWKINSYKSYEIYGIFWSFWIV